MSNMRDLINKLTEIEESPAKGDGFFLEFANRIEVETEILEITENGDLVILGDDKLISLLEDLNVFEEQKLLEYDITSLLLGGAKALIGGPIGMYFSMTGSTAAHDTMSPEDIAWRQAKADGATDTQADEVYDKIKTLGPDSPEAKAVVKQSNDDFQLQQDKLYIQNRINDAKNFVSDTAEATKLAAQDTFKNVQDAASKIQSTVQDKLPPDTISKLAEFAKNYALPGAAIVALLYGGKKLYDYLTSDSKQAMAEQNTFDKTSGGPYDRGSADAYYGRPPRPHKMMPYTGADGVKGQMERVTLTDPDEIAAYNAGYSEEDDRKDYGESISEAKYQGRTVPLGKPMKGDVKKSKVYVRNPKTGKVIKVNFGDKNMRIKKSNPKRRKSFRARHNCANPGPRTKARYWSCRKW